MRGFMRDRCAIGQTGKQLVMEAVRIEARSITGGEQHTGSERRISHGRHRKKGMNPIVRRNRAPTQVA
ncbi:hypothetical protein PBS_09310 [Paraburkholderia sp. 2C]